MSWANNLLADLNWLNLKIGQIQTEKLKIRHVNR